MLTRANLSNARIVRPEIKHGGNSKGVKVKTCITKMGTHVITNVLTYLVFPNERTAVGNECRFRRRRS